MHRHRTCCNSSSRVVDASMAMCICAARESDCSNAAYAAEESRKDEDVAV